MAKRTEGDAAASEALELTPDNTALEAIDLEETAGIGTEKIGINEQKMPTLLILQAMSPQLAEIDAENFIPEAKAGMFFETVSKKVYDGKQGVEITVCHFDRVVVEWAPRESGGGFVAKHPNMEVALQLMKPGNNPEDTFQYYCVLHNPDGTHVPLLFGCSRTKMGPGRLLNNLIVGWKLPSKKKPGEVFVPASFSRRYILTTEQRLNSAKKPYYNFKVTPGAVEADPQLIRMYKQFHDDVVSGAVRINPVVSAPSDEGDAPSY